MIPTPEPLVKCSVVLFVLVAAMSAAPARSQTQNACERLESLTLPQARVVEAQAMKPGEFTPPERSYAPNNNPIKNLPAFCRVLVTLTPSADSDIQSELWLPEKWNGRLQML